MWASAWFDQSNLFFRSIEHRVSAFLKRVLWLIQTFFKSSFQTFLFSPTWQGYTTNFLSFSSFIFARFSSLKADKTILSLFLVLFSCFHAYFHAFKGNFRTSIDLGFSMIQGLFSEIDHGVLLGYCYIHVCYWLIWSIWVLWKIENSRVYVESNLGILFNWVEIDKIGLLFWCNWSF